MFFLQNLYFKHRVYTKFYQDLDRIHKNKTAIILMDTDSALIIVIIINFKAILFKKRKNSSLLIKKFTFCRKIANNIPSEIYDLVKKYKNNLVLVQNEYFVEMLSKIINQVKILYNLTFEQQYNIWNEIFSLDENYFKSNNKIINCTLNSERNKWID